MSAAAAPASTLRRAGVSRVVERLARALEREVVPDAVVVAVPRSIALAQRVAAALELPLEIAPVVTVGASRPGAETAAVTPDGHVYVWDGTGVDGERLEAAALHAVDRARTLEAHIRRRRSGTEGTWLLVARGATGPAETVAALRWLRRQGYGRFVAVAAEWDDEFASAATAWADRVWARRPAGPLGLGSGDLGLFALVEQPVEPRAHLAFLRRVAHALQPRAHVDQVLGEVRARVELGGQPEALDSAPGIDDRTARLPERARLPRACLHAPDRGLEAAQLRCGSSWVGRVRHRAIVILPAGAPHRAQARFPIRQTTER